VLPSERLTLAAGRLVLDYASSNLGLNLHGLFLWLLRSVPVAR
jgi:hypothetical protein